MGDCAYPGRTSSPDGAHPAIQRSGSQGEPVIWDTYDSGTSINPSDHYDEADDGPDDSIFIPKADGADGSYDFDNEDDEPMDFMVPIFDNPDPTQRPVWDGGLVVPDAPQEDKDGDSAVSEAPGEADEPNSGVGNPTQREAKDNDGIPEASDEWEDADDDFDVSGEVLPEPEPPIQPEADRTSERKRKRPTTSRTSPVAPDKGFAPTSGFAPPLSGRHPVTNDHAAPTDHGQPRNLLAVQASLVPSLLSSRATTTAPQDGSYRQHNRPPMRAAEPAFDRAPSRFPSSDQPVARNGNAALINHGQPDSTMSRTSPVTPGMGFAPTSGFAPSFSSRHPVTNGNAAPVNHGQPDSLKALQASLVPSLLASRATSSASQASPPRQHGWPPMHAAEPVFDQAAPHSGLPPRPQSHAAGPTANRQPSEGRRSRADSIQERADAADGSFFDREDEDLEASVVPENMSNGSEQDELDRAELAALQARLKQLCDKERRGKLPFPQDIEKEKLEAECNVLLKKLRVDEDGSSSDDDDDDQSTRRTRRRLDEGSDEPSAESEEDARDSGAIYTLQDFSAPKKPKGTGKRRVAKTPREVQAQKVEKERQKELKKKQKQKAKPAAARKTKLPTASKAKTPKASKKAKDDDKETPDEATPDQRRPRMRNVFSNQDDERSLLAQLRFNDPIADRVAQPDFGEAPVIKEMSNKRRQINALIASVPDGSRKDGDVLEKASRIFGYGAVKPEDGMWRVKGLSSTIYHHQMLGASFMINREVSGNGPPGGIVGDSMGLGKTIQAIALMVSNRPTRKQIRKGIRATLIIVPKSLEIQWKEEIRKHLNHQMKFLPKFLHYEHSKHKELDANQLEDQDIVLTSYASVLPSYPVPSKKDEEEMQSLGGTQAWEPLFHERKGVLQRIKWYRIILDEAHEIKNYKSYISRACQELQAVYRWTLSGTPITNNLNELFPYFRFLRAEYASDYNEFKKYFGNAESEACQQRLASVLSLLMIRRTLRDRILGRPIIELPPTNPTTEGISFSAEERVLYRMVENRFRDNFNQHFAAGTAERNYTQWIVQLLRLRQLTAHPFLLEGTIRDLFTIEDLSRLKTQLLSKKSNMPIYEQIEQWVTESDEERRAAQATGARSSGSSHASNFGRSDFGAKFVMAPFLDKMSPEEAEQGPLCRLCQEFPTLPVVTDCNHLFCKHCLEEAVHRKAADQLETIGAFTTCPVCDKIYKEAKPYKLLNGVVDDEAVDGAEGDAATEGGQSDMFHGQDALGHDPGRGMGKKANRSRWLELHDSDPEKYPLLPSAKAIAIKARILKWLQEHPDDKIIIYSQFILMLRILGRMLGGEGLGFVYFTGDMSIAKRDEAVKKFQQDPDIPIFLASLKVGGIGLNITEANRVISVDLFWNHAIEQQAFGRVFRIGQKKETHFCRIFIKNSVDARLLQMQAHKIAIIDNALATGDCSKLKGLTAREMAELFGWVTNKNGKTVVEADYNDADEQDDEDEQPAEPRITDATDNPNPQLEGLGIRILGREGGLDPAVRGADGMTDHDLQMGEDLAIIHEQDRLQRQQRPETMEKPGDDVTGA